MATAKKSVAKPAKKVAPSKTVGKTVKAAPKAVAKAKPLVKKAAPKKATVPAKKAVAPAKPVKKAAATTKKATPAKKVAPVKKVAPKKVTPSAKKASPVNTKVVEKKVAKPTVKEIAKPAPKKAAEKVVAPKAKASVDKKVTSKGNVVSAVLAAQKPTQAPSPAPAAFLGREEKKNNIVIAHRKLESKKNEQEDLGKTMINYQPDYTRSILTPQEEEVTGPVFRYNDEELNEFKELILTRLEKARKELAYQQGLMTRKDEAGTDDTENRFMNMEDGSGAMEREQLAQMASRQIQFINHLEKALIRIENKTYGICRVTGKLIDKARLRAVPHATLSIEAKNNMKK